MIPEMAKANTKRRIKREAAHQLRTTLVKERLPDNFDELPPKKQKALRQEHQRFVATLEDTPLY